MRSCTLWARTHAISREIISRDCFDISFWSGMGIGDESGRVQRPRSGMKEWYLISFYFCRVFDCLIILLYKHFSGLTASHRLCQCDAEYSAEQRMGTFQIPRASRTSRSPRSRAGRRCAHDCAHQITCFWQSLKKDLPDAIDAKPARGRVQPVAVVTASSRVAKLARWMANRAPPTGAAV